MLNTAHHMIHFRGTAAALLLAWSFTVSATAQSSGSARLSLDQAVELALANNPRARTADARTQIADARIKEVKAAKLPVLQFSQSVVRSNDPVFVFGSLLAQGRFGPSNFAIDSLNHPNGLFNFRSQLSTQFPIFDQRQTSSRVEQAEASRQQAELQAEAVRQRLRFDVVRTYFGLMLGKELLKVSDEAVRSADANRKKTRDMVDVGMTTEADLLAAEVEYADAGQKRLEAENELSTTTAALNIMLGDPTELDRPLKGDLAEKYFPIEDQAELIRMALANRPDYRIAQLRKNSSDLETRAVKDQSLPRVDAFGNVNYNSPYIANGSADYTVGVSLTYTIFDAGRKART